MISIKKYLDKSAFAVADGDAESNELLRATLGSYRSALHAFGKSAVQACPAPGHDLAQGLASLEGRLAQDPDAKLIEQTQESVETELAKWGQSTADHLKAKADEVKELLIILASTVESVGERDKRFTSQFGGLTTELKAIANLDDLTQVRSSLVRKATEMRICVDQMALAGQNSLAQLRSKVSVYETKLKAAEQLAAKDTLTGVANRRSIEARMEWHIALNQTFCVVALDLNLFKDINDKYGHIAGDDLLKQFSQELQTNVRTEDLVGRWGGDEFIVVLNRDLSGAKSQIERIRRWVFGDYTIQTGTDKTMQKIYVTASIGLAEWQPGKTIPQVIEEADDAMYLDKRQSRKS